MNIDIQIKTILFSFIFGIVFSICLDFNYKYIVGKRKVLSPVLTFLFVFVFTLIYFILLRYINYGIFHVYEIFFIFCGFLFEFLLSGIVEKKIKK